MLPYAAATFAAYAAGAALFSLCATMGTEIVGVSTSMSLNGATIAGIVICAVFLAAAVVFAALAEGIPAGVPGYIFHTVCKGCGAVFALVALAVVGSGVAVALNNIINLYLAGAMDSAVFFPLVNGVGLVLGIVAGLIVFREKLTLRQWIGIVCGVAATLLLCL